MKTRKMVESSDEEDPVPDFDTCDENELNQLFKSIEPVYEVTLKDDVNYIKNDYILHLTTSSG